MRHRPSRPGRHLILFVREPRLGRGKRRLARAIGDVAALRFERLMLSLMIRRLARNRRWSFRLAVTPACAVYARRVWPAGVTVVAQGPGDLGERMRRALAECPPGPAMLIGNDIPSLTPPRIATAFRVLGRRDVVFGPARDGGFWLIGVRRSPVMPPLFGPVRWSTRHALADAVANLPSRFSVGFAATLDDVDSGDAYRRLNPARGF